VTPSALMVFTREKRAEKRRGWLSRLFRRKDKDAIAERKPEPGKPVGEEPEIAYPKAAE
jgi:multidrug efflux pump